MECLTILPGRDKRGRSEDFASIHLKCGELYTIVGNTGSGKSRLIKDVEQLAQGRFGHRAHHFIGWSAHIPLPSSDAVGSVGGPSWTEHAFCSGHHGGGLFAPACPLPQPADNAERDFGIGE